MRFALIIVCLSLIAVGASPVSAQETIDVAKITCNQFLSGSVADSRSVTIWLSGYYNGTRKNTVVNVSALQSDSKDVLDYCISHPSAILMDAVTTLFATKK